MSLVIPLHAKIAFNSQSIADEPVVLMTVTDSSLTDPIRLCSYPATRLSITNGRPDYGIVSLGETFIYAITGTIPGDIEGTPMQANMVVDNVSLEFTDRFVGLSYANNVDLSVILASDPDTVIRSFNGLLITQVDVDEESITLSLGRNRKVFGDANFLEPWPSGLQTWQQAPGLHR